MRTQTAIIGAGPAGLLLSQLLYRQGIDAIVLERRSAAHVAGRIRAGVIEQGTVELLHEAGVGERLAREGLVHRGFNLGFAGEIERIDIHGLTGGRTVVVYGQTEITRDLMDAHAARDASVFYEVDDVRLDDLDSESPSVTFFDARGERRVSCDFVAGCDGFHGVSRAAIPEAALTTYEKTYPFAWLGVLADVPPCDDEIIYSTHERGFALASMRSHTRSRYYVQCAPDERLDEWSDERFWDEVCLRLGPTAAARLTRGPAIEKSLAPRAQLRRRTDALRAPLPCWRRGPYRAAHGGEGTESRSFGRPLPVGGACSILPNRVECGVGRLFFPRARARVESVALFMATHVASAPFSGRRRIRAAHAER